MNKEIKEDFEKIDNDNIEKMLTDSDFTQISEIEEEV